MALVTGRPRQMKTLQIHLFARHDERATEHNNEGRPMHIS